jgi:hypothetical protein
VEALKRLCSAEIGDAMPYVPIPLPPGLPAMVERVIRTAVDPALSNIHFLMTVSDPSAHDHLLHAIATLLMSAIDGSAELLVPGDKKFTTFVIDNFPWGMIDISPDEVAKFLYLDARCSLIHRFGLYTAEETRKFVGGTPLATDSMLTKLEESSEPRKAFIERNDTRIAVHIEPLYWALRQAIPNALSTSDKINAVNAYVASGAWERKRRDRSSTLDD